ncbi:hypothetical protein IFM89_003345 [Coptis chinensis]|uniref:Uncharacterized protein n=1 Tax=Coptis chinensis TaxID=261450 RepID=A0A835IR34_9MAGN|nr:hypothetical protein IFM89_003345 [Coptis chinensis]
MENPGRLEENFDVFSAEIGVLKHLRDEVARRGEPRMNRWLENVQGKVHEENEVRKELNEIQRGVYSADANLNSSQLEKELEKRKEDKGIIETEPRWRDEKKGKELEGIIAKTRSDKKEEEDNAKEKMVEKRAEKDNGGQGDNTEKETKPEDAKQVEEERTKGRAEPQNSYYHFYYRDSHTPQIFSDENPNAWCSIQ